MMNSTISKILSTLLLIQSLTLQCKSFSVSEQRVFVGTPTKTTNRIVSDLMTSQPNLFTLSPHTPVDEAIATLLQAGVSGAPVVERLKNVDSDRVDCRLGKFVELYVLSLVHIICSFLLKYLHTAAFYNL